MKKPNKFKTDEFLARKSAVLSAKSKLTAKESRHLSLRTKAHEPVSQTDTKQASDAQQTVAELPPSKPRKRPRDPERLQVFPASTKQKPPAASAADGAGVLNRLSQQTTARPDVPEQSARKRIKLVLPHALPQGGIVNPNWQALQSSLPNVHRKRKKLETSEIPKKSLKEPEQLGASTAVTQVLAVDCEMVGVGPGGSRSVLARVCIVNNLGTVLLDKFVRPGERVTDFRTQYSGVRPADLKQAEGLDEVAAEVARLVEGRILVGHAITNDLQVLLLGHPRRLIRDTAFYPPLMRKVGPTGRLKPQALRNLAASQLGLAIQVGEHSPVDDARATLYLYHRHRKEWEQSLQQNAQQPVRTNLTNPLKGMKQSQGLDMRLAMEMADL